MENTFYLDKLTLTNFRQFESLDVQFKQGINVLIGVNGSGKTTVLQAIYAGLRHAMVYQFMQMKSPLDYINLNFIRKGMSRGLGTSEFIASNKSDTSTTLLRYETYLSSFPIEYYTRAISDESIAPAFKLTVLAIINTWALTLNGETTGAEDARIQYNDFAKWYIDEDSYENRIRLRENNEYRNPVLETLRKAMELFYSKLSLTNFHTLRVEQERIKGDNPLKDTINEYITISKNNETYKLDELSFGEKVLLMLVVEITHQLIILNPDLKNQLLGVGIVLIDEIDLHLHPKWQREVLPALAATFPNIQFIVTTHSPQVLSKIEHDRIILLEDNQAMTLKNPTYGRDANSILMEVFGVEERPIETVRELNKLFALLDEDVVTEEVTLLLKKLQTQLGNTDYDIMRATAMYQMLINSNPTE